jgi:hypothetical protein
MLKCKQRRVSNMANLTETLQKYPIFQELPIDKKHVLLTLATEFEENDLALYLSPSELTKKLNIGNTDTWNLFLSLEPTKNYIKKAMAEQTQIAHRKAFAALTTQAQQGNVQAAKQIQELAGVFSDTDNNKVVVLHRVSRPKKPQKSENKNS